MTHPTDITHRAPWRRLLLTAWLMVMPLVLCAQELNAQVSFNVQQIDASYRERFTTLREALEEFINGQQWTATQFGNNERITCTFAFTINEMPANDTYKASLTVQSRRPVYNSSYHSTLVNWRDDELTFTYTEGMNLVYNEYNLDNELIAITAYYCYLVLGIDFDSFSPQGGEPYLRKCENIVSQMQSSEAPGWKAYASKRNRHALVTALLDQSEASFRTLWYSYHREGLDAMHQSMDKGRARVTATFASLKEVRSANSMSPLLSFFIAAKQEELCNIYSEAPMTEKREVYNQLTELFPTYTSQLSPIREEYKE